MRTAFFWTTLAFSTALITGCAGNPESEPDDGMLAPPEPGKGVQYKMTATIESGTEAEKCMFVQAPDDGLHIQRDEVRFSSGSHHFLLYQTTYTEIPTAKEDGTKVDTSGVFDCSDGATNGWSIQKLVGGSQNAKGGSFLNFPENVAMNVTAGSVLLMNAHYINTTDGPLEPEVRINLYTIPASQVEHEGDILFFYNAFIGISAQSGSTARMRCAIHSDITLTNFQSHMHRRGVGYEATVVGDDPFYENDKWEGVPVLEFDTGKLLKKGSVIDYHCDYQNNEEHDIFQGPRTTDEMCMAIGSYYPADPTTSQCAIAGQDAFGSQNLGAEWVGNGDKTCAQTMGCVQSAFAAKEPFKDITTCMMDAAPEKSKEVSDAIRCLVTHKDPLKECTTEFSTCQAN
jgi:hypothetical protein